MISHQERRIHQADFKQLQVRFDPRLDITHVDEEQASGGITPALNRQEGQRHLYKFLEAWNGRAFQNHETAGLSPGSKCQLEFRSAFRVQWSS